MHLSTKDRELAAQFAGPTDGEDDDLVDPWQETRRLSALLHDPQTAETEFTLLAHGAITREVFLHRLDQRIARESAPLAQAVPA
jgi:hypothetical protein